MFQSDSNSKSEYSILTVIPIEAVVNVTLRVELVAHDNLTTSEAPNVGKTGLNCDRTFVGVIASDKVSRSRRIVRW